MAGDNTSRNILNNTLLFIVEILKKCGINNWFIAYGTLLGIVRENSCIDGDDDVDIMCDIEQFDVLKLALLKYGFTFNYGHGIKDSRFIIKTIATAKYCTVDFYMATVDKMSTYHDKWEKVKWTNCYFNDKLIEYRWKNVVLYLPHNFKKKLIGRYGSQWKTPLKSKGVNPPLKIL